MKNLVEQLYTKKTMAWNNYDGAKNIATRYFWGMVWRVRRNIKFRKEYLTWS